MMDKPSDKLAVRGDGSVRPVPSAVGFYPPCFLFQTQLDNAITRWYNERETAWAKPSQK